MEWRKGSHARFTCCSVASVGAEDAKEGKKNTMVLN